MLRNMSRKWLDGVLKSSLESIWNMEGVQEGVLKVSGRKEVRMSCKFLAGVWSAPMYKRQVSGRRGGGEK